MIVTPGLVFKKLKEKRNIIKVLSPAIAPINLLINSNHVFITLNSL